MRITIMIFTGEGISAVEAGHRAQQLANEWLRLDRPNSGYLPEYIVTTNATVESTDQVYSFTITIVRRGF